MIIFYLITTFIVLLTSDEAVDKATSGTKHLPNQGAAASREGWLGSERSEGLGRDVWVVDVRGVQSHLRAEPDESIEQVIGPPLQGRWSCPQDPEADMI
jgi:hypothetical protein